MANHSIYHKAFPQETMESCYEEGMVARQVNKGLQWDNGNMYNVSCILGVLAKVS